MELSCHTAVIIHTRSTPTPPNTPPTAAVPSVEPIQTLPVMVDEEGVKEEVQVVSASELTPLSEAPKKKKARRDYDHLVKVSSPNRTVLIISSGSISSQPLLHKEEEKNEEEEEEEKEEEKQIVEEKLPKHPTQAIPRIGQSLVTSMCFRPGGSSSSNYDHIPLKKSSSLPASRAVPSQTYEASNYLCISPEDDTYEIPDDLPHKPGVWRDSCIYSTIDETKHKSGYSQDGQDGEIPVALVSDGNSKDYSYATTHMLVSSPDEVEHGKFTEGEKSHHYSLLTPLHVLHVPLCRLTATIH